MADDSRRATDNVIFGMVQDIGRIEGTLKSAIEGQEKVNDALTKIIDRHDGRLTSLETSRTKGKAVFVAGATLAGGLGSGLHVYLEKIVGLLGK